MNERIRKLALQAGCHSAVLLNMYGKEEALCDSEIHDLEHLQKFAELIVKECARLAMTNHHSTSPTVYDEMEPYEQGCDDTASAISGLMCRTFGVE